MALLLLVVGSADAADVDAFTLVMIPVR